MAAWSFPKKGDSVESVARPWSAESLDGRRVRGKLSVRFDRAVPIEVGERAAAEIAGAIAGVVGEVICERTVPFTGEELVAKVTARFRNLSSRVSSFNVGSIELADAPPHAPTRSTVPPATERSAHSSGVMQAVAVSSRPPPEAVAGVRTLWPRILAATPSGVASERIGRLFAPALRDSTAAAMFVVLGAVDPAALDRLEVLEGRSKSGVLPRLRRETCACLAAAFYRVLVSSSVDASAARSVAQTACAEALSPDALPAAEIQRYMASAAPLRELSHWAAAALGAPDDTSRLFTALSSYGSALRTDLVVAASNVRRVHGAA